MDDDRLKKGGSILDKKYFEDQLRCIREIWLSERKFYQKITDIYATAMDYDVTAQAMRAKKENEIEVKKCLRITKRKE